MTTHLSARLAWHDRGWDGRVCAAPHLNAHCIVHQHIRDSRDDDKERKFAGTALSELDGWLPPCSRDPAAYADRGFVIVHRDPLEFRQLPSVSEDLPPYSSCPAPYRWMREEFFQEVCEAEDLTIRGPEQRLGLRARSPAGAPQAVLCEAGGPQLPRLLLLQPRQPPRREHAPHHRRRGQGCGLGSAALLRHDSQVPGPVPGLVAAHHPGLPRPGCSNPVPRVPARRELIMRCANIEARANQLGADDKNPS